MSLPETCVYGYDVQTKQQSSHWNSPALPHPKKAGQVRSLVKAMLLGSPPPLLQGIMLDNQYFVLSGGSEMPVGCGTKKVT
jgi:hypothetical protein